MMYVPRELLEEWSRKDPIARYERFLLGRGFRQSELDDVVVAIARQLDEDVAWVEASPMPDGSRLLDDVYGDRAVEPVLPPLVREWQQRQGRSRTEN
jgi:TPP-dependent pyruvate/acetoin dehydrogenase alpha subunit